MSEIKNFNDRQGNTLALAAADDKYMIGGALVDKMQSEKVPFFITTYAMDIPRGITMYALTDEFYTTYKNKLLKMTASGLPGVVTTSFRNFVEPEDYLQQFAEALSQMKLTPMAQADLPSYMGQNRDTVYNNMMAEYNAAFEMEAAQGAPTYANNTICKSVLVRYTGTSAAGVDSVVLAGMDYQGVEYYTTASAIGPLGTLFKGLQKTKSSTQFGHGTPCDAIDWGAVNKFLLITPAQYEQETTSDFIDFVSTFHMEPNLRTRFYQAREARKMQLQQEIQAQNAMLQAQLASRPDTGSQLGSHARRHHGQLEQEDGLRQQDIPGALRSHKRRGHLHELVRAGRRGQCHCRPCLPEPVRRRLRRLGTGSRQRDTEQAELDRDPEEMTDQRYLESSGRDSLFYFAFLDKGFPGNAQ